MVYHVVEVTFPAVIYHSRFLLLKPTPCGIPYVVYHGAVVCKSLLVDEALLHTYRVEPNRDFKGYAPASPLEKEAWRAMHLLYASSMSVSAVMLGHISLK